MTLELVLPGDTARVIPLAHGQRVTIGRIPQCEIQLDDQAVSRRHCTIELDGVEASLTDLGSANGTFVNDVAVTQARVKAGDRLRIGSTVIEVRRTGGRGPEADHAGAVFIGGDDSTIESLIRRRIDPAQFEWLSAVAPPGQQLPMLQRAQRHLSTLHRVAALLAGALDESRIGDPVLRAIVDVVAADRAAIVGRRGDEIYLQTVYVGRGAGRGEPFPVSRTIVSDVIQKGVSTFAHDAAADARFRDGQSVIGQHIRAVMCVPLRTADDILGALYVDSLSGAGKFNEADLELLAAIGNQVGVALHRVRLLNDLEKLLFDTIRAIAATVDARDGYTHRHSERVAAIARHLAREMGWTDEQQECAELAALLHDVGKIAVPDAILNKPDRLTPDEFEAMKQHPVLGARILANIQSAQVAAILPGIKHHHERWDGAGYPDRLSGASIPALGRLISVADFFDAMTSTRAYREPLSVDEAVALVCHNAGTHFDPEVAKALDRLHGKGALAPLTAEGDQTRL